MLLQRIDNSGYPVEYLATRVGVRKSFLVSDWQPLLAAEEPLSSVSPGSFLANRDDRSAEGIWNSLLRENRWVYLQMDNDLREDFAPFFSWQELKTVFLCLRNLQARKYEKVDEILGSSLLRRSIKGLLSDGGNLPELVEQLEVHFVLISSVFCGMAGTFRERGTAGLEIWLNDTWLEWVCGTSMHIVLRDFFACLVDFRNLMELHKRTRWQIAEAPRFLRGGRIRRASLFDALNSANRADVSGLYRRFPGGADYAEPAASPEHYLLRGITRLLHGRRRMFSGYGRIIEYLWLAYLETVNMGIILETTGTEREKAVEELVR